MNRLQKLTLQYYRLLLTYNIVFTLLVITMLFPVSVLSAKGLLLSKIVGFAAAAGLQYFLADKTLFYFRNAGFSARRIIITAFLMETGCSVILLIMYNLILNAAIGVKG